MRFWIRFALCLPAVLLGVALGGCAPGQGQADDEKESHYVLGQNRVNTMDFSGARDAFGGIARGQPASRPGAF